LVLDISEEPLFPYDDGSNPKKDSKDSFVNTQEVLPNYSSWASRKMKNAKIQTHIQHFLRTFRKFILRKHQIAPSENGRIIPIEVAYDRPPLIDERTSRPYCSNVITSSVYTPYTFLPRQLYAQFSKLANL
jgi:phospholipid-translocating ATPase